MRRLFAIIVVVFAFSLLAPLHETSAAYQNLPTSVCSNGVGQNRVYDPHTAPGFVQTWGELICNNTNRYHKVELYYFYNSTQEWKRVAYVDHYTTLTDDVIVVNQCSAPSSSGHVWQARGYVGGGYEVWSTPIALYRKIAADGSCSF